MSLFGTSPPPGSNHADAKPSLFSDDDDAALFSPTAPSGSNGATAVPSPVRRPSSSLFADDGTDFGKHAGDADAHDPWGMPTPKKASRGQLVRRLLTEAEVPDAYRDAWRRLLDEGAGAGAVTLKGWAARTVGAARCEAIWELMGLGDRGSEALAAPEFWVLLALVGLAEEGEEVSLDGVDERRRSRCLCERTSIGEVLMAC